ncbi:hypothetical protein [Clostridium beijerinckii]|uniref:hypothetical protein n=1 Tax=Clostridium beijerinckii TaxID=1520 RepID=UPI00156F8ADF|nr:hypothetical protein [Clostridium beijerinckii]NRU52398.1 hypothetical protein [Clostridium beijerinckii]NYC69157.1 hypothetical protein [Clostridium beijerinckii]NYC91889.1 hypothetical protein [Clostridium beijerinckii]
MLCKGLKSDENKADKSNELIELKKVLDNHNEFLRQKQETYLDFLAFLSEQQDWDRELIIIREEDWNEFYSTDDEDYEMKILGYVQAHEFYDKFTELVGIDTTQFENNFVSAKYI